IDIHDDIIDQSKTKDSRPTVLGKCGKDIALLAGDALLFKGLTLLHEAVEKGIPAEKLSLIISILKNMFFELGDAEALELHFRGRLDVTPEEYLHVVRKKAADVESYTRISAILGGGTKEEIDTLGKYGRILGMMAILRDDLTDMLDYEEAVHRITKECLPLPMLFTLQNSKVKAEMEAILQKKTIKMKDAETILEISDKTGGLEHFQKFMEELRGDAYSHVSNLRYNKNNLELLIDAMIMPL
ncbi:MAG: polyprenyl synthetase family protein, partial [Candidatus Bathyarchaeota archaeon]